MEQHSTKIDELIRSLKSRHGLKFDELKKLALKFADYLKTLDGFKIVDPDPLIQIEHVGRVIVDAVLQVGHDWEKQVRKRVERIRDYPEAATLSGFIDLLRGHGISRLLDWNSQGTEKDLLDVAEFFAKREIETFSQMREWLKSEDNRDSLLTDRSGLGGNTSSTFKVADKTADYFRLLVGHCDAVAVDKAIGKLLAKAQIISSHSKKYNYKEKRAIVQLAAIELKCRPIDLDHSIYVYYLHSASEASSKSPLVR